MNRVHLPEFLDFEWFPAPLKDAETNLIVVLARLLGASEVLAALVSRVLRDGEIDHIVDLGSGAGGPMPDVLSLLREASATAKVTLTMTDLYPNLDAIQAHNIEGRDQIRYHPNPVDAGTSLWRRRGSKR